MAKGTEVNICMLLSNDFRNDPRVTRHVEALAREGFRVVVVCALSDKTLAHEHRQSCEVIRVRSRVLSFFSKLMKARITITSKAASSDAWNQFPWAWLILNQISLARAARQLNAQIYCANDFDTLFAATIAAGLDRKLVYDSHELWPDMLIVPQFFKKLISAVEGLLIKRADLVMTVNQFIAHILSERYSIDEPACVYNFPPAETSMNIRPKQRSKKQVLYHGIYEAERGLENLIKAAEFLEPDVELVFRGYGSIEEKLTQLASGKDSIIFEKPIEMKKLIAAARSADVGIVPYIPTNLCNYLSSPNKLFEYIQAGLPIVASDLPFIRKVVRDNEIGALFNPRDPQSIAKAINAVTRDSALEYYRKNVDAIKNKYTWEREEPKFLRLYQDLASDFPEHL